MNEGDGASVPSAGLRGASVGWINGEPVWFCSDGRCWPMDPCDASETRAATVDWTEVSMDATPIPADFVTVQQHLQDGEDAQFVEDREGREFLIEWDVDEDRADPEDDQGADVG